MSPQTELYHETPKNVAGEHRITNKDNRWSGPRQRIKYP